MKFEIESKFNVGDEVFVLIDESTFRAHIEKITLTTQHLYRHHSTPILYTVYGYPRSRNGKAVSCRHDIYEENIFRTEAEALVKEREYQHEKNFVKINNAYISAKYAMDHVLLKSCHSVRQREEQKLIRRFVNEMKRIRTLDDNIEVKNENQN